MFHIIKVTELHLFPAQAKETLNSPVIHATLRDPPKLQRIFLLLLAERLYTDLVEPAHHGLGKPEYCLQTTMELLGDLVSSLYVGGLPRIQELWEKVRCYGVVW